MSEFLDRLALEAGDTADGLNLDDGLSLHEGRLVALEFNPALRLARMRIGLAVAGVENAGLWQDPSFSFNAARRTDSTPDPWLITPGLAFSIPLSGRRAAERDRASAGQRAAEGAVLEAEWALWHEVEQAWIIWSGAQLRVAETERLIEALQGLVRSAPQLAQSGEMTTSEAALFSLEQARHRNQLGRLRGEMAAAELALRALMGLAPEAPIDLSPSFLPDASIPEPAAANQGPGLIERFNPRLERRRREYDASEEKLRHEVAKQYPILSIGPYSEFDEGKSRVGLLGGLPLPFLNANRRAIAEARVEREIARAVVETEYETLVGTWSIVRIRLDALRAQRADMEQVLVPLVDRQLEDTGALLRLGEGTGLGLLESLSRAHQLKLDLIETRVSEALARSEFAHLLGPTTGAWPFGEEELNS